MSTRAPTAVALLVLAPLAGAQSGVLHSFPIDGGGPARVLGDVDGDGFDEIVVGDSGEYPLTLGSVSVHSGRDRSLVWEDFGERLADHYGGGAITILGDLDGDGANDLAVGGSEPGATPATLDTYVRVLSGRQGVLIYELRARRPRESFGRSITVVDDLDSDGVADLAIGAPSLFPGTGPGLVYLVSGADGAALGRLADGVHADPSFGFSAARFPDLDGDGFDELAVGAPYGRTEGFVQVKALPDGALHAMLSVRIPSFTTAANSFGRSFTVTRDLDGDGIRDLAIGAPTTILDALPPGATMAPRSGSVHWMSVGTGIELQRFDAQLTELSLGWTLGPLGDVDSDGVGDFYASDRERRAGCCLYLQGNVRLHSGADGSELDRVPHRSARSVESLGDLNGDGAVDLLVGGTFSEQRCGPGVETQIVLRSVTQPREFCGITVGPGCDPCTSWTGAPSLTAGDDFTVTASSFPRRARGHLFWGLAPNAAPFHGGLLCVGRPLVRLPLSAAGGTATDPCSGVMVQSIRKAYLLRHGLSAGTTMYVQFWGRHPTATGFGATLSPALAVQIWP